MTTRAPNPYEPPRDQSGSGAGTGSTPGSERPRKRGFRPRNFIPLAVVAWALLEIWLLTLVADAAGGMTVFALIVAGFVLGAVAIKRAGRRAWNNLAVSVQKAQGSTEDTAGEKDAKGRGGNALAMLGGLLIMVPGLISDVAGLLCLSPPTAGLMRRLTRRRLGRREGFAPGTLGDAYQKARSAEEQVRMHRPDGKVVEGEVVEGRVIRDDDPPTR